MKTFKRRSGAVQAIISPAGSQETAIGPTGSPKDRSNAANASQQGASTPPSLTRTASRIAAQFTNLSPQKRAAAGDGAPSTKVACTNKFENPVEATDQPMLQAMRLEDEAGVRTNDKPDPFMFPSDSPEQHSRRSARRTTAKPLLPQAVPRTQQLPSSFPSQPTASQANTNTKAPATSLFGHIANPQTGPNQLSTSTHTGNQLLPEAQPGSQQPSQGPMEVDPSVEDLNPVVLSSGSALQLPQHASGQSRRLRARSGAVEQQPPHAEPKQNPPLQPQPAAPASTTRHSNTRDDISLSQLKQQAEQSAIIAGTSDAHSQTLLTRTAGSTQRVIAPPPSGPAPVNEDTLIEAGSQPTHPPIAAGSQPTNTRPRPPRSSAAALLPRSKVATTNGQPRVGTGPVPSSIASTSQQLPRRAANNQQEPSSTAAQGQSKSRVRFTTESPASGGAAAAAAGAGAAVPSQPQLPSSQAAPAAAPAAAMPAGGGGTLAAGMMGGGMLGLRQAGLGGWAVAAGRSMAVHTRMAQVQSVAEAQENGEALALQDEASYALDGLRPQGAVGRQRESLVQLAELLATRRGRAALRAEDLAQQVVSRAALLPLVSRDPALALSGSVVLLALSAPDAHAAYMASEPAMRLAAQLMQAADLPCDIHAEGSQGSACEAHVAPGGTGSAAEDAAAHAMLLRAVKAVKDGTLGRHASPLLGHAGTPLRRVCPLVLLALQAATTTDACKIHYTEHTKHAMRKAGLLGTLAQSVCNHCHLVRDILRQSSTDQPQQPMPQQPQSAACDAQKLKSSAPGLESEVLGLRLPGCGWVGGEACGRLLGALVELRLMLQVLENATFTCEENECELLNCKVRLPSQGQGAAASQGFLEFVLQCAALVQLIHMACSEPPQQSEPTPTTDSASRDSTVVENPNAVGGTAATGRGSGLLLEGGRSSAAANSSMGKESVGMGVMQEQLQAGCGEVLVAALGLLMNLTHNHADARDRVVAAGGAGQVLQLVAWCSAATPTQPLVALVETEPVGQGRRREKQAMGSRKALVNQQEENGAETADGGMLVVHVSRQHVICHMELLTVCLGLMINTTSTSSPARQALRDLSIRCGVGQQLSDGLVAWPGGSGATQSPDAASQPSCSAVQLLCGVLMAVMPAMTDSSEPQRVNAAGLQQGCSDDVAGIANPAIGSQGDARASDSPAPATGSAAAAGAVPVAGLPAKRFVRGRGPRSSGSAQGSPAANAGPSSRPQRDDMEDVVMQASQPTQPPYLPAETQPMAVDAAEQPSESVTNPSAATKQAGGSRSQADAATAANQAANNGGDGEGAEGGLLRARGRGHEEGDDHLLVTESSLQGQRDEGEASIVQVYVSMLLGFTIQDCGLSQRCARRLLPGHSLAPLVGSITHMLQFYLRAGAITDSSRDALLQLLQVLAPLVAEEEQPGAADAAAAVKAAVTGDVR